MNMIKDKRLGLIRAGKRLNYPNLTHSVPLAYILGVLKGDGCVHHHKGHRAWEIILTVRDKKFATRFQKALRKVSLTSHLSYVPRNNKPLYRVISYSKLFAKWYNSLNTRDIKYFLKTHKERVAFLRGAYDSEGSYYITKSSGYTFPAYAFAVTNKEFVDLVHYLLSTIGFSNKICSIDTNKINATYKYNDPYLYQILYRGKTALNLHNVLKGDSLFG